MTPPPNESNAASGRGVDLFFGDDPEPESAPTAEAAAPAASDEAADAYDKVVESAYDTSDVAVEEADALQQAAGESSNGATPAGAAAVLPPPEAAAPPPPPPPPPVETAEKSSGGSSNGCLIGIAAMLLGAMLGAALALAVLFSVNAGFTYASRAQMRDATDMAGQLGASADALRGDVTTLQGALGSAQNDLDQVGQRQEALNQTIAGLAETQAAIDERLKAAEAQAAVLDAVQQQLDQTDTNVAELQTSLHDVNEQIDVVASELTSVTQQVEEVAVSARRSDNFLAGLTALLASLDDTAPMTPTLAVTPTIEATTTITPGETLTETVAPTATVPLTTTATPTATVPLTPTIAATATVTPSLDATVVPTATLAPDVTPSAPAGSGAIQGIVYFDRNQDGARDGTVEPGIAGVEVTLYTQNRSQVAQATTNFRGQFEFTELAPGIYVVVESDPSGFLSSTPNNYTVRVLGASPVPNVSFGDYR